MILLLGYGYWGKNLARNFGKNLSAVCDIDENNLKAAKETYPWIKTYQDIETALKDPNVDAVAIATKPFTHHALAIKALNANKHLWIEKPVTDSIKDLDDIIYLSEKNNRVVLVDHTFCYNPAVRKIQTIDIGNPLYYDSLRISMGLFQKDVDVILDLAIHDVSIIEYLYPNVELKDRTITKNSHVGLQANQCMINLVFNNNFTATINCNWLSPVKKRHIILTGTSKSIVYDDIDVDKVKVYEIDDVNTDFNSNKLGSMMAPKIETSESLQVATRHFLECIKESSQPITNLRRAKKIMEWLL